ncbi:MAG: insulinase family protein [Thermodesulfobacteriota bacterium]
MKSTGLSEGHQLHGFTITRITPLPDLRATLYELTHEGTGAELIHFANEDDNNLFSVAFRTTPMDSTGVAHILEHTVLCGSKRFPVRDPFFSMLKRSLNTFMNAFTASDWTMYPFSTQNEKDYYNLMAVYLDAVFFPLLSEMSFQQEGWRLEFDGSGDLLYKGVVFNEMKGAMSDPNSLMSRRLQQALYPSTTYHYNSGGEPEDIPSLSLHDLKAFHAQHYHPSNARFMTYGSLPLEKRLEAINERILSRFTRIEIHTAVGDETRFKSPGRVEVPYPFDPATSEKGMSKKAMASVAWLACRIDDSFEVFALDILSSLLLGNPAAPLYKALMDSQLGQALAPGTGYSSDNRETAFAAGLQGIDAEDGDAVEELVLATLAKRADEGFSRERIEAVIHRAEFSIKEVVGNYGLTILFRLFGSWVHNGSPVQPLLINENLDRLRSELDRGRFFEEKIRHYFIDNNHRMTLLLKPDPELGEKLAANERAALLRIADTMSAEEKKKIVLDAANLESKQEGEEDISCLPTLQLSDIPPDEQSVEAAICEDDGIPLQWFDQPTNGITYFNASVDVSSVPVELKPYVPLFCTILTRVGAAGFDYTQMAERIEAHTGGISADATVWEELTNLDSYSEVVGFSAKAVVRKEREMFEIVADIFNAPDFSDRKRLHTLIGQIKTSMENSVPASGHTYARSLAALYLTPAARLREAWDGIRQLQLIKELGQLSEDELDDFVEKMESIKEHILNSARMKACVVTEKRGFDAMSKAMKPFLSAIPKAVIQPSVPTPFEGECRREGWSANVPVSYVANLFRTVHYTHEDSPPLQVLAKLLRSCYLHREIREKGGAYGGYATFSTMEGLFSFLSYRDPHITRTLHVYNDAIKWVLEDSFSDEDLKEAILGVFADLDKPLSPSGKGNREFILGLRGLTLDMRRKRRADILSVTRRSLIQAAEKHLKGNMDQSSVAVISSEEKLEEANKGADNPGLTLSRI